MIKKIDKRRNHKSEKTQNNKYRYGKKNRWMDLTTTYDNVYPSSIN